MARVSDGWIEVCSRYRSGGGNGEGDRYAPDGGYLKMEAQTVPQPIWTIRNVPMNSARREGI